MLLQLFTSLQSTLHEGLSKAPAIVLLSIAVLSGCSTLSDNDSIDQESTDEVTQAQEDNNGEMPETFSGNDVEDGATIDVGKQVEAPSAKNLYLEQQAKSTLTIPDNIVKKYQQALVLMENKKWQEADAIFDTIILTQPLLSGSYVNKGLIAKKTGELDQARIFFAKAIEINSLNLYAHHELGQVYRLQGEFDNAEQSYAAALAIWPNFAQAHASMGVLLELYRGRFLEAYTYYTSYLVLAPNDEEVQRWQAGLAIKIKRAGLELPQVKVEVVSVPSSDMKEDSSPEAQELTNE